MTDETTNMERFQVSSAAKTRKAKTALSAMAELDTDLFMETIALAIVTRYGASRAAFIIRAVLTKLERIK